MKAVKTTAIILAVILLFIGIICFFYKPLYYRVYPWDRITGTIHVTIDGEEYELKNSEITASYTGHGKKVGNGYNNSDDGTKVSMHGGDYGPYSFFIRIEEVDSLIEAVVYQYNSWNVTKFDLDISIDHTTDKITVTSTAQVLNEEAQWTTQERKTESELSHGKITHYIVSI